MVFALSRSWLEHSVINADVLARRVELAKHLLEARSSIRVGNLLQIGRGLRQMLADGVGQGTRRPQENTAVPVVSAREHELLCAITVEVLSETTHPLYPVR